MDSIMAIRPSKDLRNNYSEISKLVKERPVAITVNGKEDIVCLSHEYYTQVMEENYSLKAEHMLFDELAQAEDDIKLGRVSPAKEAIADILSYIENK